VARPCAEPASGPVALARRAALRWAPRLAARWLRPDDRELGELGERLAARALRAGGWRVLGRRVRTPFAELDLVALRGDELCCVEVKTSRASGPRRWRPGDRLRPAHLRRQRKAAGWLAARTGARTRAHLALCEVYLPPAGGRPRILLESLDEAGPPASASRFHPGRSTGR
jgi:putative endonuclease